jgi:nucleotide-binding universal stress UspA family protein
METTHIPAGAIVVGVDGSESDDRALAWAADEAALDHRPLVLVHAIGSLGTPGTVWLTETDRLVQEMREHGEDILAAASLKASRRHPAVEVYTSVVIADAPPAMLAAGEGALMMVVGSRGRGPVRSLLLGSVSATVARHANCPVVVVRPHHPGTVRRGVLVGADGTSGSLPTLEFAYREASVRGLPLAVMHCVWDVVASSTAAHVVPLGGASLEEARLVLAESIAGMSEKYPDVHVTTEIARGLPDQCLGPASERMDLLVVGRRHAGALSRAFSGDAALHLVEHAHTVVALVPEPSGPTNPANGTSGPARPLREPQG